MTDTTSAANLKGAGFTLSSVGQTKTAKFATPIVPVPQVAILAATALRDAPVVRDGALAVAPTLPLSLGFDHRALNGAAANAFLDTLAETLAAPEALIPAAE